MNNFALDISKFVEKAKANITTVVRKVSLEVFTRVIQKTPVDMGRAKGNWQTTIGTPASDVLETTDENRALNEAANVTGNYKPGGESIYLTNNVPYIEALENGHSGQFPEGMVEVTLTEYPGIVEKAAEETNK